MVGIGGYVCVYGACAVAVLYYRSTYVFTVGWMGWMSLLGYERFGIWYWYWGDS